MLFHCRKSWWFFFPVWATKFKSISFIHMKLLFASFANPSGSAWELSLTQSLPAAGNNHSVAEALLLFLDALPEPVVPYSFYYQCLECCSNASQCEKVREPSLCIHYELLTSRFITLRKCCDSVSQQVISMLPQCHQNVFNYLTAFLRELLKHTANNRLDINILCKAPAFHLWISCYFLQYSAWSFN